MELIIKKCPKCGATVEVLKDCKCENCGITCCGMKMKELKTNSTDASFEKHVPEVTIKGSLMEVTINHVMEEDHYIEWIGVLSGNKLTKVFLKPFDEPKAIFHYQKNSKVFSYCNKHALWMKDVD